MAGCGSGSAILRERASAQRSFQQGVVGRPGHHMCVWERPGFLAERTASSCMLWGLVEAGFGVWLVACLVSLLSYLSVAFSRNPAYSVPEGDGACRRDSVSVTLRTTYRIQRCYQACFPGSFIADFQKLEPAAWTGSPSMPVFKARDTVGT